jgi:hypothetical protein
MTQWDPPLDEEVDALDAGQEPRPDEISVETIQLLGEAELARRCGTTKNALRRWRGRAAKGEFGEPFPKPNALTSTEQPGAEGVAGWHPDRVIEVVNWLKRNGRGLGWRSGVTGDTRHSHNKDLYVQRMTER